MLKLAYEGKNTMSNYYPVQIRHADNSDVQGYELKSGDVQLETLAYNIDKFSVEELKQKKRNLFSILYAVNIQILTEESCL